MSNQLLEHTTRVIKQNLESGHNREYLYKNLTDQFKKAKQPTSIVDEAFKLVDEAIK